MPDTIDSDDWTMKWRRRAYEVLEVERGDGWLSQTIEFGLVALITLNAAAFVAESVPSIAARHGAALWAFEVFSVIVFTIEYACRLWSCVEMPYLRRMPPWRARLRFAMRPYMIIDLVAILPFYLQLLLPMDLRMLRVLRLFRLLKLTRYSPALHALLRVMVNERKALAGASLLMMLILLFAATGAYLLEREAQPESFGSIPDAAWWAMATLTTVGYGDVAPITPLGQLFGAAIMIAGLGLFAVPIAIISSGFAQEVSRRDFVITWPMLARIPLLAELEPKAVAELLPHLSAHNYPPQWAIIPPGAAPRSMFFIASGRVALRSREGDRILAEGDFFGEGALFETRNPIYHAETLTRVRALEIEYDDFQRLEHLSPAAAAQIRHVADSGGAGKPVER